MANYKETTISGDSYVRCSEINIFNGLENKLITFREEELMTLAGSQITKRLGEIGEAFTEENANTEFALLDITGAPTGNTATYMDVYTTLYSLYFYLATRRDAELEASANTEPSANTP